MTERLYDSADAPNGGVRVRAMLNIKIVTWSLGIFAAISFVLCVIYGLIVPPSLHMAQFLEMALPAFKWLTFWGFCLGLIESFLYGGPLLGLALVGQFGLAIFEATFALYAQAKFNYGPVEVGAVFMVCGLVMTVFQVGAVGFLAVRIREMYQIGVGFGLMGMSLALPVMARTTVYVFALVGLFALGTAFISPNLAAVISKRGGSRRVGAALGVQNAANSLGQASGPLVGGRAVHSANERAVLADRGIVGRGRFGYRVESDG